MSTQGELDGILSVIFVVNAVNGPKVVFRYPHDVDNRNEDPNKRAGIFPRGPEPQPTIRNSRDLLDELRDSSLQGLLIPKTNDACGRKMMVSVDSLLFIGYPFMTGSSTTYKYNVVFVVERRTPRSTVESLLALSTRMSVALSYEERTCGYLTENLALIDRLYNEMDIPALNKLDPSTMDDTSLIITEHCPFRLMIESPIDLAVILKNVYDNIRAHRSAKILINNTINFSFFLQSGPSQGVTRTAVVAPFESFVLLETPRQIKQSLSCDSCPSLVKLLDLPRPYFRSLRDIALSIDIDFQEVCRSVVALVQWRKALIIFPVVSTNEYMVSSDVPVTEYPVFAEAFTEEFKKFDFYIELAKFSQRTSLSEILDCFSDKDTIDSYRLIVIWLLRRRLLVQLFAHVYIKPAHDTTTTGPAHSSLDQEEGGEAKKVSYPSLTRGAHISDEIKNKHFEFYLSSSQNRRLREMDVPSGTLTNFAKVLPHANTGRTSEEILWRTNLQPFDLHDVIKTFSEFLVTIRHPTTLY